MILFIDTLEDSDDDFLWSAAVNVLSTFCSHKRMSPRNITEICLLIYHNQKLYVLRRRTRLTKQLMKVQHSATHTGGMPILSMITLLREFLTVSCVCLVCTSS